MSGGAATGRDALALPFAGFGDAVAIVDPDGRAATYAELARGVEERRAQLRAAGLRPAQAVLLEGDYGIEACAWLFALWREGCVVVPVTPGAAAPAGTYAAVADVSWRLDAASGRIEAAPGASAPPLYARLAETGAPGLVIFSSGTSGVPKGALHDVTRLASKFARGGKAMRTLGFLLFDHISGVDTLLYTLFSGGTLVCLPSRNPAVVCRTIAAHRVEVLPTAPTFLNMLLMSEELDRHDLSCLKIVTYGGETMPQGVLDRVAEAFPQARIVQKYGASEFGALRARSAGDASRWISFDPREVAWRVRDGLLELRVATAMLGYLNAPSPFTEDGWQRTGDRVEVEGDRLRILGRDSDLINVGGQKVFPAEIEDAL
ncbi:class I adenylate-forming enzyme family protein, partial [Rubrimonas sp.]|uniref:class I adenylate-forming enzyme family protein n=1 Tax=Rubrimonas sp. TaxID=2036015 RepID=UPI002FDE366C